MVNDRASLDVSFLPRAGSPPVEWVVAEGLTPYGEALAEMEARAAAIADGACAESASGWSSILPLYTAGTSARDEDLVEPERFPVHRTGRGGQFTYHGPGQRVAYVMLDLKRRREDVRAFVAALEAWLIATLWRFHVRGERREDRVGVWVARPERGAGAEDKIAAIGDPAEALGVVPRHRAQCRAGPGAFFGHRALRRARPWRHQPRRPRTDGDDGRCRHRAARRFEAIFGPTTTSDAQAATAGSRAIWRPRASRADRA